MCLDVVLFIKSIYIEKAKKDLLFFKKNLTLLFFRYINISQECLIDKKNKLKIKKKQYSGVPNRSAGTYAEFRLRRWRHGKFFYFLFKT